MIIELLIGITALLVAANWDKVKEWIRDIVDGIYNIAKATVEGVIYWTEITAEVIGKGYVKIVHKITEKINEEELEETYHTTKIKIKDAPDYVKAKLKKAENKPVDVKEEILKDAGVSGKELEHALSH